MRAKVSIVIPVYNADRFLRECLDSLFSQSLRDIEVICVNDGSRDNSQNILDEYAARHPNMIVIQQENHGIGHATNRGIEAASGEYLYSMDNDDTLVNSDVLSLLFNTARQHDLDILTFNYTTETQVTRVKQPINKVMTGKEYLLGQYLPPLWSKLCRLEYIHSINFRFLENLSFVDTEAVPRLLLEAERVMHIDEVLYRWRRLDNSTSSVSQNLHNIRSAYAYAETTRTYNRLAHDSDEAALKKAMLKERFKAMVEVTRIAFVVDTDEARSMFSKLMSMDFTPFEKYMLRNEARFYHNTYVRKHNKLMHPWVYLKRKLTKLFI